MIQRCWWARQEPEIAYHDTEWGVPLHDDRLLFEYLILEGAQAGLSWSTILRKRENYRKAFDNFDAEVVARYGAKKTAALLANEGIVRNRLKVASAISNAQALLKTRDEFGSFNAFVWRVHRRQAEAESLERPGRGSRAHNRVRRYEPGTVPPRIPLRGQHHLLRLHAGRGHG